MREDIARLEREPKNGHKEEAPKLVLLHGWLMHNKHMYNLAADKFPDCHLISLRAPVRLGPGRYRWFDFEKTKNDGPIIDDAEEVESLQQLTAVIEEIAASAVGDKVFLLAHSQGGTMSLSLTLTRPDLVAGCADVNGRILTKRLAQAGSKEQFENIKFFHGHGTNNSIVPFHVGQQTVASLRELSPCVHATEYNMDHEITEESVLDAESWMGKSF